ncbi:hypothetical protein S83_066636 [Arachis hypogaea]
MDPEEQGSILEEFLPDGDEAQDEMIDVVENMNEWTHRCDNIVTEMYEEWRTSHLVMLITIVTVVVFAYD